MGELTLALLQLAALSGDRAEPARAFFASCYKENVGFAMRRKFADHA